MTLRLKQRNAILDLAETYGDVAFTPPFVPGETYIPPSGKVIGGNEMRLGVCSVLDGWFTEGRWTDNFEERLAQYVGTRFASFCNSGSSANLLAVSALTSQTIRESARLKAGDEAIVAAVGFPTTLNPVIQNGLRPVFVDVNPQTYVPMVWQVEEAITDKTKLIIMAHTLGNPTPHIAHVARYAQQGIAVIEDNCDALGSLYLGKRTGGFGHLATQSFYPAHHITTGEGGAVLTNDAKLHKIVESFRDWGRSCWCAPGKENTCGCRFDWKLSDGSPVDHKYLYSDIGYNLKATDMQAALGCAQLERLDGFIERRRENFAALYEHFSLYEHFFVLPKATSGSQPAWFGFPLTVRDGAPFNRQALMLALNEAKIGTRLLFAGDTLKQPAYRSLKLDQAGRFPNAEHIGRSAFWIGCWPGIDKPRLDYMMDATYEMIKKLVKGKPE